MRDYKLMSVDEVVKALEGDIWIFHNCPQNRNIANENIRSVRKLLNKILSYLQDCLITHQTFNPLRCARTLGEDVKQVEAVVNTLEENGLVEFT